MFQSPRNRVNISNRQRRGRAGDGVAVFQSPRNRVNISNRAMSMIPSVGGRSLFQSPRNRVNISNAWREGMYDGENGESFNPLEIGSTFQMRLGRFGRVGESQCFNPLEIGSTFQIKPRRSCAVRPMPCFNPLEIGSTFQITAIAAAVPNPTMPVSIP